MKKKKKNNKIHMQTSINSTENKPLSVDKSRSWQVVLDPFKFNVCYNYFYYLIIMCAAQHVLQYHIIVAHIVSMCVSTVEPLIIKTPKNMLRLIFHYAFLK